MPHLDLAVIGAGPAGAATTWTAARQGLRVAVFERGALGRDKVCGEFVSAEALPLLEAMAPALLAAAPVIDTAVFVTATGRRAQFRLPQPARGISRLALDAALAQAAVDAGAALHLRTAVADIVRASAGFRLALAGGGIVEADAVVVAAGRGWNLPSLSKPDPAAPPRWMGVKARFRGVGIGSAVELYGFRGGYCGLAPVENGWTNACCLIRRDRAGTLPASRDFAAWIAGAAGSPSLSERLRGAEQATPTVITAPVSMGHRAARHSGALIAGDACGFPDPFTGDGLARALLSGQLAAKLLADPCAYASALARATRPAHRAGAVLRLAFAAPAPLQAAALGLLDRPWLASRLLAATRWH